MTRKSSFGILFSLALSCGCAGLPSASSHKSPFHPRVTETLNPRRSVVRGQDAAPPEPLVTDRPDFTESSSTVGRGRVQLEGGYTFTHDSTDEFRVNEHVLPEFLLRVGLTDELELRLGWEGYVISRELDRVTGMKDTVDGGTDMDVGVKLELLQQDQWIPEAAVITAISVPTGADAFSADKVQPAVNFLYSWGLTDWWAIGGSTGLASLHESGDGFVEVSQSVATGVALTECLGSYLEWFAFFRADSEDDGPQHFLNGGFTYLITPDFQIDWRAGFGLNERSSDFFTGAGFAVRY